MVALTIEEQKPFTAGLFLGEIFDRFLVRDVKIITFNRFDIDGKVHRDYYSKEEQEEACVEEYSAWKTLKPICYQLIKGKKLPESFQIVFQMPETFVNRFVTEKTPSVLPEQVGGLYLNVRYENHEMGCITGISMKQFSLDRSLENEWDQAVKDFLKKNGIVFS